jgi:hypothetical protein
MKKKKAFNVILDIKIWLIFFSQEEIKALGTFFINYDYSAIK